jgi:hypothetical protein
MKSISMIILLLILTVNVRADMKYHSISFVLSVDKESYYQGEKITFLITISNTDKESRLMALVSKLFFEDACMKRISRLIYYNIAIGYKSINLNVLSK